MVKPLILLPPVLFAGLAALSQPSQVEPGHGRLIHAAKSQRLRKLLADDEVPHL